MTEKRQNQVYLRAGNVGQQTLPRPIYKNENKRIVHVGVQERENMVHEASKTKTICFSVRTIDKRDVLAFESGRLKD